MGVASFNETADKIAGMPTVQFMSGHTQTVTKSTVDILCLIPESDAVRRAEACKKAERSGLLVVAFAVGGFCSIGMLRLRAWLTSDSTWSLMPVTFILFVFGVVELLAARLAERRSNKPAQPVSVSSAHVDVASETES